MKRLLIFIPILILASCIVEDQIDFSYNGPTVAEFKNRYLEEQTRIGTANFQSIHYNVVTLENTALTKITVRQPAVVLKGVITSATNSTTVTGQAALTGTGVISGNTLTVSGFVGVGQIVPGLEVTGAGIAANTKIVSVINAATGTNGTYVVSPAQTVASTPIVIPGTTFTTDLQVGSLLKTSTGTYLGAVASITTDNSLTLAANATTAVTRSLYRASFALGVNAPAFQDSILIQMVGPQKTENVSVTYIEDPTNTLKPEGAIDAVEGVHYSFVNPGEVTIPGNKSAAYLKLNILEGLTAASADRVTLIITLTDDGDIGPSANYKTFIYTIIK